MWNPIGIGLTHTHIYLIFFILLHLNIIANILLDLWCKQYVQSVPKVCTVLKIPSPNNFEMDRQIWVQFAIYRYLHSLWVTGNRTLIKLFIPKLFEEQILRLGTNFGSDCTTWVDFNQNVSLWTLFHLFLDQISSIYREKCDKFLLWSS